MAGTVSARLTPAQQGRKFGLTVGIAFLVFAGISYWRGHVLPPRILGGLGATLTLAGLVIPSLLLPVEKAWMGFAHLLSKVTTPIFMGVVYFVVFTPFGIISRALGKNALVHTADTGRFFITLDQEQRKRRSMARQF